TLGEALEKYEHHFVVVKGNKTTSWPETRRRILRIVGDPDIGLDAVTPRRAQRMYEDLVASGMAVDSHRGCLTNAKTFFAWAASKHFVAANPFADVAGVGRKKVGRPKRRRDGARAFAAGAFRLIARTTDPVKLERYLMGLTALYLGARASEITLRQVRDIDDDCTLYVIPDAKTPSGRRTERIPEEL